MDFKKLILLAALFLIALLAYIMVSNPATELKKEQISNAFVDINGDGMIDFLISGEVILNTGSPNFPYQPTNSQP